MKRYRANVCAVLVDDAGERVLVFRRVDGPMNEHRWQFPQGGLNPDETPEQGLYRELREEIGTVEVEITGRLPAPIRYTYPPDIRNMLSRHGHKLAGYDGQEQHWFLARLLVPPDTLRFDTHAQEFDAWEWVAPPEAVERVVPFKRGAYRQALRAFGLLP